MKTYTSFDHFAKRMAKAKKPEWTDYILVNGKTYHMSEYGETYENKSYAIWHNKRQKNAVELTYQCPSNANNYQYKFYNAESYTLDLCRFC